MNKWLKWMMWLVLAAGVILGADYAYGYWIWSSAAPGNPDLSRVITYEGRTQGIFTSRLDGADKKEITGSLELGPDDYAWLPRFSPDGKKIAFATGHLNRAETMSWDVRVLIWDSESELMKELYKANIPTTSEDDLPQLAQFYISWSLDNSKVAFTDQVGSKEEGIILDAGSGQPAFLDISSQQPVIFVEQPGAPDNGKHKWLVEQTYFRSGEFGSFGENAIFVKPRYSLFRKKILSEYSYHNGVWIGENHLIVDGPRDIIVVDIKGNVKARIPDARHFDLQPR